MKSFIGYVMLTYGFILLFFSASASDSDLPLVPCIMMASVGLLSFIFGALTLIQEEE